MVIVLLRVQTLINIRDKVSEWCYPEWICSLFLGDRLKNIPRSNLRFSMSYCIQLDYSANCMQAGSSTWVEKWGVTKYVSLVGCAFTKAGLTTYTIYTGVSKLGPLGLVMGYFSFFLFWPKGPGFVLPTNHNQLLYSSCSVWISVRGIYKYRAIGRQITFFPVARQANISYSFWGRRHIGYG